MMLHHLLIKTFVFLCSVFTLLACTNKSKSSLFEGEFVYFADAAVFKNCDTGESYNIVMEDDYLVAEQRYLSLNPHQGEFIFCRLQGYLQPKPTAEEGFPNQLVITSFDGFDRTISCK